MPIFEIVLRMPLPVALTMLLLGLVGSLDARQAALVEQLVQRLEGQVRVDRRGAVAEQAGEVVDLARLAGLDHEARLEARALAHEVVVHAGHGEQRRNRHAAPRRRRGRTGSGCCRRASMAALASRQRRSIARSSPSAPSLTGQVASSVSRAEDVVVDLAQLLEVAAREQRLAHDQLVRVLGRLVEQVRLGADGRRGSSRPSRGSGRSAGS